MKKSYIIISILLVITAVTILSFTVFARKAPEYTFETASVSLGRITNVVTATGTIEAILTVNVGTQVSGIIKHVYVDFNNRVKKGEVLAKLDATVLKAQVQQGQATLDEAVAQYNFQKATFDRLKVLYQKSLIAKADYDQALYNFENSKAALSNARSALERTKVNLEYATIYSPIDGVVLNRAVEEGQTVAASFNTPTLFTIANDLTQMEVQTSVDEADIGKVKEGQRVEFTVDAYPDLKFEGIVSQVRLQPITTNNVVTYTVILHAGNTGNKLMPGMTASATIYVAEKNNALIVSGRALRFRPDQDYLKKMFAAGTHNTDENKRAGSVPPGQNRTGNDFRQGMPGFRYNASGSTGMATNEMKSVWIRRDSVRIERVPVTTGIDNGTNVEVLSGLKEGDRVVVAMADKKAKSGGQKQEEGRRPFFF